MLRAILWLTITFFVTHATLGRDTYNIDSLQNTLKEDLSEIARIQTLNRLATATWSTDRLESKTYLDKALKLAQKLQNTEGLAISYYKLGVFNRDEKNYAEALSAFRQALPYHEELGNLEEQADIHNQIGIIFDSRGAQSKALQSYLTAQRIVEKLENSVVLAHLRDNIGVLYSKLGDEEKALELYRQNLTTYEKLDQQENIASTYVNIGVSEGKMGELEVAQKSFSRALEIFKKENNLKGLAYAYGNLGDMALKRMKIEEGLNYYQESEKYFKVVQDKKGIALSETQIGIAHYLLGDYKTADEYLSQGIKLARQIEEKEIEKDALKYLSQNYEFQGQYQDALKYFRQYEQLRGELFSAEKSRAVAEVKAQNELKDREEEFERREAAQEERLQRQNYMLWGAAVVAILVLVFGILQYYNSLGNRRMNRILLDQKDKIADQNKELYHRNTQIGQSIQAARTIQQAILPPKERLEKLFNDHFIFYRPKDIVSGDFYWTGQAREWTFLASVDCTGHGVPGAFMSMIGSSLLDNIVLVQNEDDPKRILERLHEEIRTTLHQEANGENSGMDAAFVAMKKEGDLTRLHFSGARQSLCYVSNGNWEELKGDRRSIGGHREIKAPFTTQQLDLKKGDVFYIFSDGYPDQHNLERKKFGSQAFKDLLYGMSNLRPLCKQKVRLAETLDQFRKTQSQRDDILVVGVEV
ncbi:MAG: tetratricopeptide repeat protein [Bacteroidota bacterium]